MNLLIAAKFEEAQCEGSSKSNFAALLLIDRQKFCARQTIVDNSVNTLTEKIANQFIVNELLYVVTLVNRANGKCFKIYILYINIIYIKLSITYNLFILGSIN